jgi:hypothetical protein
VNTQVAIICAGCAPSMDAPLGRGGRYVKFDLAAAHYGDAADTITASDGRAFTSNQATIFRWQDAF